MHLEDYLKQKLISEKTIKDYKKLISEFLEWLAGEKIKETEVRYKNLLDYLSYTSSKGDNRVKQRRHLIAIRHYFNYRIKTGKGKDNPAQGLYIKGVTRRIPHNLLDAKTLESLYKNYPVTNPITQRNKVILGLIVYQGLRVKELERMRAHHLQLKEGKLFIAEAVSSASRTLKLEASQVLELHQYVTARKEKEESQDQLFTTSKGKGKLQNLVNRIIKELKVQNKEVKGAEQIRMSVITEWLKVYDLRVVQYMAGHKYVSSTERYVQIELEELKIALEKYHPLG